MPSPKEPSRKYSLESVLIYSSRSTMPVEIANDVSDIEIYEHIDMPFLTAKLALVDSMRLMDRVDFQGAEFVVIKIKPSIDSQKSITKRFVVEVVMDHIKTNETSEFVTLSLYEDILYKSNYKNVNKAYSGEPFDILNLISEEYLDREIIKVGESAFQKDMKVIIPNLDPLKAIAWVKNRMTTSDGVPQYVFSTLGVEDKLFFGDLLTMMESEPVNNNKPFMYVGSPNIPDDFQKGNNYLPIHSYNEGDKQNMFRMIQTGYIGSSYQFYDAFTSRVLKHNFNYKADVIDKLPSTRDQSYNFSEFEIDGDVLNQQPSRVITQISGSGAYNIGAGSMKSYNEEKNIADHNKKIIGKALKTHLLKTPVTIRVPGQGFIKTDTNMTIGNTIRLYFLNNKPAQKTKTNNWDMKKSGDYLVYATKHSFTSERYDIHLTCAKLKDYTSDAVIV